MGDPLIMSSTCRKSIIVIRWTIVALTVFTLTQLATFFVAETYSTGYTATAEMKVTDHDVAVPTGWNRANPVAFDPPVKSIITSAKFLLPMIRDQHFNRDWATAIYETNDPPLTDAEALDYIRWRLKIEIKPKDIVDIHVSDQVPEEAAAGANAIAERFAILSDGVSAGQPLSGPVSILAPASIPLAPDQPDQAFYVEITVILGIVLGIGAATAIELLFVPAVHRKAGVTISLSGEESTAKS